MRTNDGMLVRDEFLAGSNFKINLATFSSLLSLCDGGVSPSDSLAYLASGALSKAPSAAGCAVARGGRPRRDCRPVGSGRARRASGRSGHTTAVRADDGRVAGGGGRRPSDCRKPVGAEIGEGARKVSAGYRTPLPTSSHAV